jgi:hypothetical protein
MKLFGHICKIHRNKEEEEEDEEEEEETFHGNKIEENRTPSSRSPTTSTAETLDAFSAIAADHLSSALLHGFLLRPQPLR